MRLVAALIGLSLVGCTTDSEPIVGESTSSAVVNNKLAANKLAANKLAANKLAANKLAANKLELNQVGANELLETAEGREVLAFIVSCAIAPDMTLVATHDGTDYEFFGEVGLANHWLTSPIDDAGAGWVSACLFARVNASNVPIPISLRGNSPMLATDADEQAGWALQEGAFFGNFFTEEVEGIDWNACRGADQAAGEFGGLTERDCAEPCAGEVIDPGDPNVLGDETFCEIGTQTKCGFNYAGDCGDFAPSFACKQFNDNGTFYKKCAAEPLFSGNGGGYVPDSGAYRQVITVYLQ